MAALAVSIGLAVGTSISTAEEAPPLEEKPSVSLAASRAVLGACQTIWAQESDAELTAALRDIGLRLAVYRTSIGKKLDVDIKALADLRARLESAENTTLDTLAKKAEQMPAIDPSKIAGGAEVSDFVEKQMITSDFTDARDLGEKVAAKRYEVQQAIALLAALDGAVVMIRDCGRGQREWLKEHPAGARLANGPRYANGVDPTLPDRTKLNGTVTGVYSFTTCKGTGSSWTQKQGFTVTVDSNFAVEGKVIFRGQTVPVHGYIQHDARFNAIGTLAVPGGKPFTITLTGLLAKGGLGSPTLTAGTIVATDRATGGCKGTLL